MDFSGIGRPLGVSGLSPHHSEIRYEIDLFSLRGMPTTALAKGGPNELFLLKYIPEWTYSELGCLLGALAFPPHPVPRRVRFICYAQSGTDLYLFGIGRSRPLGLLPRPLAKGLSNRPFSFKISTESYFFEIGRPLGASAPPQPPARVKWTFVNYELEQTYPGYGGV